MSIPVKTSVLQVRIDSELLVQFHDVCSAEGETASRIVRDFILDKVKRRSKPFKSVSETFFPDGDVSGSSPLKKQSVVRSDAIQGLSRADRRRLEKHNKKKSVKEVF